MSIEKRVLLVSAIVALAVSPNVLEIAERWETKPEQRHIIVLWSVVVALIILGSWRELTRRLV